MATNKDSEDYKAGWYDGYQEALKGKPPVTVIPTIPYPQPIQNFSCPVCGRGQDNAMHYVCSNWNCPTKVRVTSPVIAKSHQEFIDKNTEY